jgi:hypothetical protein
MYRGKNKSVRNIFSEEVGIQNMLIELEEK